jgi:FixJ family two-component response regulator
MNGQSSAPSRPRAIVVILEDDHGARRSLQLLLQALGFEVRAYASPAALLADPAVMEASCLIADFCLGETDGIAVFKALRQLGWEGPAMLMSAYSSAELTARAQDAGFCEILEKPFREHSLLSALARVTG